VRLNVSDAARLLKVSEKTIYRWLKQDLLPVYRVNEQYRFSRAELLAWATSRRLNVPEALFHESLHCTLPLPSLFQALQVGGIVYRMEGGDKEAVLHQLAESARLPNVVDREYLFRLLLAREGLGSTGVGGGIALPQLIYPNSLHLASKAVTLAFLERPVEFDALDGRPVDCVIGLFSATLRGYYHLLNRVQFALRDPAIIEVLAQKAGREQILEAFAQLESRLPGPASGPPRPPTRREEPTSAEAAERA
jgi:PTS system nitrogen regulatory IIA component